MYYLLLYQYTAHWLLLCEGIMMLLTYSFIDFYLFFDGAVDTQIWVLLTRSLWYSGDQKGLWASCYYSPIISLLGRAWLFIWTKLNSLHQGILYAKLGWNWPTGSLKVVNLFWLFTNYLLFGKGVTFHTSLHLSFQLRWAKKTTPSEHNIINTTIHV